jgi:hypothetical protein
LYYSYKIPDNICLINIEDISVKLVKLHYTNNFLNWVFGFPKWRRFCY